MKSLPFLGYTTLSSEGLSRLRDGLRLVGIWESWERFNIGLSYGLGWPPSLLIIVGENFFI
jgi:hypothetical protein